MELKEFINKTQGLEFIDIRNNRYIKVTEGFEIHNTAALLKCLRSNKIEFEFYDELYPSPTDPGAYLSYSLEGPIPNDQWNMTLGNHGWTGGIYQILDTTIITQLSDLINENKLKEIQISNVGFFSHYSLKDEKISREEDEYIRKIHTENKTPANKL